MHSQWHWNGFKTNIKKHPWKWLGALVLAFIHGSIEHALYGWTNERIENGATVLMPYFRDMLVAAIAHPWFTVYLLIASYGLLMILIAYLSPLPNTGDQEIMLPSPVGGSASNPSPTTAITRPPPSVGTGLLDSLEILSDDGLGIHVWFSSQPLTAGLLISVINDGTEKLKSCKVRLARARSFDSKRKTFIDDPQAHVLLPPFDDVPHKQESGAEWLVRISRDRERLEIGRVDGQMSLRWPPREDIQNRHVWLLTVTVESETMALHEFHFRIEWLRPNTIKVRKP
jgi:hypothetical protein